MLLILLCLSSFSIAFGEEEQDTTDSYIIYYGNVDEEDINTISNYDIAVLEYKGTSLEKNLKIKANNTTLYGYISAIEVEGFDEYKLSRMNEDDFLKVDGEIVYIEKYGNYLGDIRSENYQNLLIECIEERIINNEFDGVFLDTVGYTDVFDEELNKSLQEGYLEFLMKLDEKHPDLLVFQNRGYEVYLKGSSKYIDALLFEGFSYSDITSYDYYKNLVMTIDEEAVNNDVKVYAASSQDEKFNSEMSKDLGWSFFFSSVKDNYLKL